ncbi:hypothetical protein EDB19DRAFT_1738854, partial [Suillus lakei]
MPKRDSPPTPDLEHELSIFSRVRKRLETFHSTNKGYEVQRNTDLSSALDKLAVSPTVSYIPDTLYSYDYNIVVNGDEAGTWLNPDVSVFQKHAIPSPFGRGEETIMDPSYRHGTELSANSLAFSSDYKNIISSIQEKLAPVMFVGKEIQLKLYKLAVYGTGGHFDWHRDSTHSDAHLGTVLFALNTEWEGGELMVRHGGVETSIDMHPVRPQDSEELSPLIVAFYTDTEHKVMPVTKGVRLVLQFDVEVFNELPPDDMETSLSSAADRRKLLASHFRTCLNVDDALIQGVADEIGNIKREYLKGNDLALFNALESRFDVSVNAVLIRFTDFYDYQSIAYSYASSAMKDGDSESEDMYASYGRAQVLENASFHLPRASAIQQISYQQHIEYIGNESQFGEARIFWRGDVCEAEGK